MDLNQMTIGEFKELSRMMDSGKPEPSKDIDGPWVIGEKYLIRGVNNYHCGRLVGVWEHELLLDEAAWISDTGRFSDALKEGQFDEVEPIYGGKVIIGRGSISDAEIWHHELKLEKK